MISTDTIRTCSARDGNAMWQAGALRCSLFLAFAACLAGGTQVSAQEAEANSPRSDDSASDELTTGLADFNRGAALMEQYLFRDGAKTFEEVLRAFPDWTAARFNLGLAYLTMGAAVDGQTNRTKAREQFEQVLKTDPDHLHARFCLGLYFLRIEEHEKALECFQHVYRADPRDPHAAYRCAEALFALNRDREAVTMLETTLDLDPGFVSGIYRLATAHLRMGRRERAMELFRRFKELNDAFFFGSTYVARTYYGSSGQYSMAIGIDGARETLAVTERSTRILLSPDIKTLDTRFQSWSCQGGAVNLPGIAVGDLNGDDHLDLVLTATDEHGAATTWINDGSGAFALGHTLARQVVSPCLGDVDNDGQLDLWLGRAGADMLLLGDGEGNFTEVADLAASDNGLTACARLLDLDSDGDVDLLSASWAAGSLPAQGQTKASASRLYNNNRNGQFPDVAPELGLDFSDTSLAAVIYDDFDNDRDLDLVVLPTQDEPIAWVNERVGKYHISDRAATGLAVQGAVSATTGDPDKDGDRDLLVSTGESLHLFVNCGGFEFEEDGDFAAAFGGLGGTGGQFVDIDNDGDLDLVIPDAHRRDGTRGPFLLINDWPRRRFLDAQQVDPGNLLGAIWTDGDASCVVTDFTGDGRCDILLAEMGQPLRLIENATHGGHFIALDLAGTRGVGLKSRSNGSAIGARVEVKSGLVSQQYVIGVPSGATAMPPLRVHAGLGTNSSVQWLRILWPDSSMQAELELAADRRLQVTQKIRLVSTCPHLFAWDGNRFALVSDFGGVGGMGYWFPPGVYPKPDSEEYVPVPKLQERDGQYVLQVLGSLEETIYVDEVKLLAVDHPADTEIWPHEMMAIGIAPPKFELFCIREPIVPERAVDHRGVDVTEHIRRIDRQVAGATDLDGPFEGYARDHFVELDFGDRLSALQPGTRLVLCLYGSTEYPYSATNYAAFQAGLQLKPPSIHVWRNEKWVAVLHEVGCPGGMQHVMAVDLTGHVLREDRKIRIASNMEIYWDRMFLAAHLQDEPLHIQEVEVDSSDLHFRGYALPYSPDGRHPELFDYEPVERTTPWKLMTGDYTRYGDVTELLGAADDCYVIMSRGDELTMCFAADAVEPEQQGRRRSFIFKTHSYTKDMDLYTAHGATVGPLPFQAMSGYPYSPQEQYPDNDKTERYRRIYNTRRIQSQ